MDMCLSIRIFLITKVIWCYPLALSWLLPSWQMWIQGEQVKCTTGKEWSETLILIIMYIYYALVNALSAHIIYINLNTIFYTYVEDSPTKTIYIRHYMEKHTHTHTHNDCSRNWVLILAGAEILWEEEGFQSGFTIWQGWAVSKVLWEWIPWQNDLTTSCTLKRQNAIKWLRNLQRRGLRSPSTDYRAS